MNPDGRVQDALNRTETIEEILSRMTGDVISQEAIALRYIEDAGEWRADISAYNASHTLRDLLNRVCL